MYILRYIVALTTELNASRIDFVHTFHGLTAKFKSLSSICTVTRTPQPRSPNGERWTPPLFKYYVQYPAPCVMQNSRGVRTAHPTKPCTLPLQEPCSRISVHPARVIYGSEIHVFVARVIDPVTTNIMTNVLLQSFSFASTYHTNKRKNATKMWTKMLLNSSAHKKLRSTWRKGGAKALRKAFVLYHSKARLP